MPHHVSGRDIAATLQRRESARVVGEDPGDAGGEFLRVVHVQEFIRTMGVGVRAEHAGDEELRVRKLAAEHAHEGNGAAAPRVHGVASVHRA